MIRLAKRTALLRLAVVATFVSSIAGGLVMVEVLLRVAGYRPALPPMRPHPNEPTIHVPDPILGWRVKPASYHFRGYTPGAAPITMTYWPDGSRATREHYVARDRRIVLIGDSFTQGWAVSDAETYAWKLQARYPDVEFLNYGTAAYNGLQALLRLEEHFAARPTPPPTLVVYGLNDDQERRNVAERTWLAMLARDGTRGTVRLPYCLLDGRGGLTRYPPEAYPNWPLRDRFASMLLLEQSYFAFATRHRSEQGRPVTELLIDEMQRVVRDRGSRFLVVILAGRPEFRAHYATHLAERGIEVVDCSYGGGLMVPGEGHPNGAGHTKWADCLGRFLDADLAAPPLPAARVAQPSP
jgi:hypothetical protein